jgi:hypothetical protein
MVACSAEFTPHRIEACKNPSFKFIHAGDPNKGKIALWLKHNGFTVIYILIAR